MLRTAYLPGFLILTIFAGAPHLLVQGQQTQDKSPQAQVVTNSVSWYTWLEPVPGVRAHVHLTTTRGPDPVRRLAGLSADQLQQRYARFMKLIGGAYTPTKMTDESQVKDWKEELALTFVALRDRHLATIEETDQTFSVALSSPSIAIEVKSNSSYARSINTAVQGLLTQEGASKCGASRPVADKSGMILGFLEAEPSQQAQELAVPGNTTIRRTFKVVANDVAVETKNVYAIWLDADHSSAGPAGTKYDLVPPALQLIFEPGQAYTPHWDIVFAAQNTFGEVTFPLKAKLLKFPDKQTWQQQRNAKIQDIKEAEIQDIAVPIPQPSFKPKPSVLQEKTEVSLWVAIFVPILTALIGAGATVTVALLGWLPNR